MSHSRNDSLDGLRLLAVASVLAFHFRIPGARAGFLGVDVFFVLSGYLITSILLRQVQAGRVRLGEFWTRRARRLVPALIPVVLVVLVWGAVVLAPVSRDRLRADLTSTLFYFANWHFISTSTYFASDGVVESARAHVVARRRGAVLPRLAGPPGARCRLPQASTTEGDRRRPDRGNRSRPVGVEARRPVVRGGGHDRAYLGTDSRIFQPLAGALLAVLVTSPRVRAAFARAHWALLAAGVAGLGWGMIALGDSSGATAAYAHGGAAAVTASTAAVLAAVVTAGEHRHTNPRAATHRLPRAALVRHLSLALAPRRVDGTARMVGSDRSRSTSPRCDRRRDDHRPRGPLLPLRRGARPLRENRELPRSTPHSGSPGRGLVCSSQRAA